MGVLLRLGNAQLGHAQRAEIFAQAVFHSDPGPRHQHIGHGCVILRIADIGGGEILPLEPVKLRVHNGPGNLPGPVGPVVEENDAVVVGNSALAVTDHRLHKLVRYAVFIALGHGIHGVGILHALTVDHGVVGHLQPLPAFVAVHGVVAAHDGGDLAHADLVALFHALGYKVLAAGGGHIPAVQKGVDIDPLQALVLGHLQQGPKVLHRGVYAAAREQAVQVQAAALFQAIVHGLVIGGVLEKFAGFNGAADPGQVLEHHPAAADVGVAHLAVAHLPGGQTHIQSGGRECGIGIFGKQTVQHRSIGQGHGVAGAGGTHAKAVHNHQHSGCFILHSNSSLYFSA